MMYFKSARIFSKTFPGAGLSSTFINDFCSGMIDVML